jgi:hypothetical protein
LKSITGLLPAAIQDTPHYSGIAHHMVFAKQVLDSLKRHIEATNPGRPWW